jgi:exoribonuclease R
MAVGCSQRNLFYNVLAIVEPVGPPPPPGTLQRAILIKNLGLPTNQSELEVLLTTYVYDGRKPQPLPPPTESLRFIQGRDFLEGYTFHIDPPGCRDVDDSFTLKKMGDAWQVAINIADVAELVPEGSPVDVAARTQATSFYTSDGKVIAPMLPPAVEAQASLLPGASKLTVSLCFVWTAGKIQDIEWRLTETSATTSYTYDEADAATNRELKVLSSITGTPTSHEWVEAMMIFYNKEAGKLLAAAGTGILRRHKEGTQLAIPGVPEFLAYEAAEHCLPGGATYHSGLDTAAYAYASSPIRRYADLVNQRAIKKILSTRPPPPPEQELVDHLNRRQKQAKAFSRDLFFMTCLDALPREQTGIVVSQSENKAKIWVPHWRRLITVRTSAPPPGSKVFLQWYVDKEQPRWRDRIVFRLI